MWTRRGEVCEATAGLLTLLGSGSEPWTGGRLLATGYCYNTTTGAGARERERAIVTVITNAGNIKCIIFTQLVILDHLWFWPYHGLLIDCHNYWIGDWRNMYGMVCVRLVLLMFGFMLLSSAQKHYHQSPSHWKCSVCSIQIFKVSTISTLVVNQPGIATHATGHPTPPTFHIMTSHIHSLINTLLLYFLIRLKYFSKSGDIFQVLSDAAT